MKNTDYAAIFVSRIIPTPLHLPFPIVKSPLSVLRLRAEEKSLFSELPACAETRAVSKRVKALSM